MVYTFFAFNRFLKYYCKIFAIPGTNLGFSEILSAEGHRLAIYRLNPLLFCLFSCSILKSYSFQSDKARWIK